MLAAIRPPCETPGNRGPPGATDWPRRMKTAPTTVSIDREKLARLRVREDADFLARTPESARLAARARQHLPNGVPMAWMAGLYRTPPIFMAGGSGPEFRDIDGNRYVDFNVSDLSMTMGFGPPAIVAAVNRQIAQGAHFLLPTEDAIVVAEDLAQRIGLPFWQFTLSASGANTEVIRVARHLTGRRKIAIFGGHYHGHIDETLVEEEDGRIVPDLLGLAPDAAAHTVILPFNDLHALEEALRSQDIALVLTEPALTNCNVVLPDPGFLAGLRSLTKAHGSLLCIDEAHTFQFAYGGLTRAWAIDCDFVVLGKGLGSGVGFALYGMSEEIGRAFARHQDTDVGLKGLATGGTTYATALAAAVARAALGEVLTPANYTRVAALGARLADGLDALFAARNLDWRAFRLGPRSGYCMNPALPRDGTEAGLSLDADLIDARRVYMANRGVWDAVFSAGPQASFAHAPEHIDRYLAVAGAFLDEILSRQ